jgi:hypothetical protein
VCARRAAHCINCRRAIPHIVDWYAAYKDAGFEVIGVHTPEYAFERVRANVASGAKDLASATRSRWTPTTRRGRTIAIGTGPPRLIDANGTIRHI